MQLLSALEHRNYRWFITGQALSNIGNMMHQVAISWLAYTLTDSALILGFVAFSKQLASFFSGITAGVVADRFNKKKLLQYAHGLMGINVLILSWMTAQEWITVAGLLLFQLTLGLVKGVEMPARQALVNELVEDKRHLTNAIAINSTVFNTARVIGPAFAGVLIPWTGEAVCFLIYGLISLGIMVSFSLMPLQPRMVSRSRMKLGADFSEGLRYALRYPTIRISLLYVAGMGMAGVSFMVLLPILAGDVFRQGATVYGYMTSALGLGAIAGGIYLARRTKVAGIQKIICVAGLIFSLGLLFLPVAGWLPAALLAIALVGLGRVMVFAGTNTLLQTITDDDKRGRVLSLYITCFTGSVVLGGLMVGALADAVGPLNALWAEGISCLLFSLLYARQLKKMTATQPAPYQPAVIKAP